MKSVLMYFKDPEKEELQIFRGKNIGGKSQIIWQDVKIKDKTSREKVTKLSFNSSNIISILEEK